MGGILPGYQREGGSSISGFEGTYEFQKYDGNCQQIKTCYPKLQVFKCVSDTWGRAYGHWKKHEGEECTENEKHLVESPGYLKFGSYNMFPVHHQMDPVDHSKAISYNWDLDTQILNVHTGNDCYEQWKRITTNQDALVADIDYHFEQKNS